MKSNCFVICGLLLTVLTKSSVAFVVEDLGGNTWTATNNNLCKSYTKIYFLLRTQKFIFVAIKVIGHVPGSIYTDLQKSLVIDNIYDNFNDLKYRWVSYDNWTFTRHFDSKQTFYLCCQLLIFSFVLLSNSLCSAL